MKRDFTHACGSTSSILGDTGPEMHSSGTGPVPFFGGHNPRLGEHISRLEGHISCLGGGHGSEMPPVQAHRQRGDIGALPPRFLFLSPQLISCPPTVFFLQSEHRPHS